MQGKTSANKLATRKGLCEVVDFLKLDECKTLENLLWRISNKVYDSANEEFERDCISYLKNEFEFTESQAQFTYFTASKYQKEYLPMLAQYCAYLADYHEGMKIRKEERV